MSIFSAYYMKKRVEIFLKFNKRVYPLVALMSPFVVLMTLKYTFGPKYLNFLKIEIFRQGIMYYVTQTVAYSTRHSFRPKTNNQFLKKFFKLCGHLSKICQKLQNSDFQSQFSMSKIIRIFLNFFSLKNIIL